MPCNGGAWVVTRYPDGAEVHAHPQHGSEDEARAAALGYGSVGSMTFEHDELHSRLAWALRVGRSPTLYGIAIGQPVEPELAQAEEAMVLAAARFLNLAIPNREPWRIND